MTGARGKRGLLLALCLLGFLLFSALGVWQLERRVWKLDLIERTGARIHSPPAPAPGPKDWPALTAENSEYKRVSATGRLLNDRETLVQASTERGAGFWVMTPLETGHGTILVNRGFVPPEKRPPSARSAGQPSGPVKITGLLRMSQPGGAFLRSNDPGAGRWYSRDVAAIAKTRHLGSTAPYFIDADATPNVGGWPVGGLTVVNFRNAHLTYALTWFGLAILCAWATWTVWRRG